jgi:hypothetical protein
MLLVVLSLCLSIAAIRPRLKTNTSVGFIYWGSIVGHGTAQHFTTAVHRMSDRDKSEALAKHLYELASIAKRKYAYVDRAIFAGVAGGVLIGATLFLQHAYH